MATMVVISGDAVVDELAGPRCGTCAVMGKSVGVMRKARLLAEMRREYRKVD
jgi:hypothetical protein